MAKTYSLFNKRTNTFEPLMSRGRQPYSGPIKSEMLNLHLDQFIMDIARLRKNINEVDLKIQEINNLTSDQGNEATPGYYLNNDLLMTIFSQKIEYDEVSDSYLVESATPYYEDVLSFYNPNIVSSKISLLKNKLNILEKTINIE